MSAPSIFRYPGGKSSLVKRFLHHIPEEIEHYVEPFVGGGSVLLNVAFRNRCIERAEVMFWKECQHYSINDSNPDVAAFWSVLVGEKIAFDDLLHKIDTAELSTENFHRIQDSVPVTAVDRAFRFLFLNRTAFSGILTSGPIGGEAQESRAISVRWNAPRLTLEISEARDLLQGKLCITCCDFSRVIETADANSFLYLDPPYFQKGGQLYGTYGKWTMQDHVRLRDSLSVRGNWLLSYDNCQEIKELYAGFKIEELAHYRSISDRKIRPRDKSELLIFSKKQN